MSPDRHEYRTLLEKTFENTLMKLFQTEFGFMGGPAVIELIVNRISELIEEYHPRKERLHFGQILWFAVDKDEKKGHNLGMRNLKIRPVILSLVTPSDIQDYINRVPLHQILRKVTVRLFKESFAQGGVLANHDVAIILHRSTSSISNYSQEYQKETLEFLPTRGVIHDLGQTITHKEIIVRKYFDGKEIPSISRETDHSIVATERYIKQAIQVKAAIKNGVPTDEIPHVTGISKRLVEAYIPLVKKRDRKERRKSKVKSQS